MTPVAAPIRVIVTGFSPFIRDLCDDLGRQPGIELGAIVAPVADAAWAFAARSVDVVVHGVPARAPLPRRELVEIREYTDAPIVLLVEDAPPSLFDDALAADVADVIVLPQPAERVAFAIHKARRERDAAAVAGNGGRARLITAFSPKGGTGKTVVSTSVAAALAKHEGQKTLLVDLDLQFGDAAIMLGVSPRRTLQDLVTAPGELDAEKLTGYITRHAASGLDVLAAPLRPEDGELVTESKVERLLNVAATLYDAIVIDTSPSFHGPMLTALDHSDLLLLICTPEIPTLKNVRLGLDTLRRLSFPEDRIRLVLNRAGADDEIGAGEVEGALGRPVSFELPLSVEIPHAVNEGMPLPLSYPASEFAVAIHSITAGALGTSGAWQPAVGPGRHGFAGAVRGLAGLLPNRGDKGSTANAEGSA